MWAQPLRGTGLFFPGRSRGAAGGGPAPLCSAAPRASWLLYRLLSLLRTLSFRHANFHSCLPGYGSWVRVPTPRPELALSGPLTSFQGASGQGCWLLHCWSTALSTVPGSLFSFDVSRMGVELSTELQGITSYPVSKTQAPPS